MSLLGFAVWGETLLEEERVDGNFSALPGTARLPWIPQNTSPQPRGFIIPVPVLLVRIKGFEWSHMWVFSLPRHVTLQ